VTQFKVASIENALETANDLKRKLQTAIKNMISRRSFPNRGCIPVDNELFSFCTCMYVCTEKLTII
jgi:hypothetical protein